MIIQIDAGKQAGKDWILRELDRWFSSISGLHRTRVGSNSALSKVFEEKSKGSGTIQVSSIQGVKKLALLCARGKSVENIQRGVRTITILNLSRLKSRG